MGKRRKEGPLEWLNLPIGPPGFTLGKAVAIIDGVLIHGRRFRSSVAHPCSRATALRLADDSDFVLGVVHTATEIYAKKKGSAEQSETALFVGIVRNVTLSMGRVEARRLRNEDVHVNEVTPDIEDEGSAERVEAALELKRLLPMLERLPRIYRKTLELVAAGENDEAVAQALGISRVTVRVRIRRALKTLREAIRDESRRSV